MVIYSYRVDDARFMSSRVSFTAADSTNRADAEQGAARYPVGKAVQVFYNPGDPQQAVLEPTNPAWTPITLAGLCACAAVALRIMSAKVDKGRRRGAKRA
jgi:hypothetical protein